jgi:hypothetical protein
MSTARIPIPCKAVGVRRMQMLSSKIISAYFKVLGLGV